MTISKINCNITEISTLLFENDRNNSLFIINRDLIIEAFNKRALERTQLQFGFDLTMGESFLKLVPGHLCDDVKQDIQKCFAGAEISKFGYIDNLKKPLWLNYQFVPVINTNPDVEIEYILVAISIRGEFEKLVSNPDGFALIFRKIFDSSPDGKFIVEVDENKNTHLIECNQTLLTMMGFNTLQEFQNMWSSHLITSLTDEEVITLFNQVDMTGSYQQEIIAIPYRGTKFPAFFRIVRFAHNSKNYHIGSITNLTEFKIKEYQAERQEKLLKYLSKATQDAVYIYDLEANSTWVSNEYMKMFGYEEEAKEHHFEWFHGLLHPDDKERVKQELDNVMAGKTNIMQIEYRIRHRDGHYISLIDRGFLLRTQRNKITHIVGAMTDITQLRAKEKELRDSENKLLNILNTIQETVFSFTFKQKRKAEFNFFSKSDSNIWTYSTEDLIGNKQFWYEKIVEEDKELIINPALRKLRRMSSVGIEYRFVRKDGGIIWISSQLFPVKSESGEIMVIGTATNITDKKEAENKILNQNEELKKTNMELDRFVYSTSHDLRAPLTSIMGLVNLFRNDTENPIYLQYLDMMETSVSRLDKFITNIVDYSRNSRTRVEKEPINFSELIDESFEQLKYIEGFENIEKKVVITQDNPLISDRTRVQMVINNLISNAVKYRKRDRQDGFIHIQILGKSNNTTITISDNGIGIPKENLNHIFDMFYTGNIENHGSGIGLYIVKESIDKLGGSIEVISEQNKGTTFLITLPN